MKFFRLILLTISLMPLHAQENEPRGLGSLEKYFGQNIVIGKQYLLLIASDKYDEWPNLGNPVKDAREIRDILTSLYYIDQVVEIYNEEATKENIIRTFERIQTELDVHDSLIIYYAGHGYFDTISGIVFWIPTNGGKDIHNQANWIANAQVKGIIGMFKASHILLISDSCFSGDILERGEEKIISAATKRVILEAYTRTSRQVITSGAMEKVPDTSEFARELEIALRKNTEAFLDPMNLYSQVKAGVTKTLPLFGNLRETGHQLGASFFLFFRKPHSLPPTQVFGNVRVVTRTTGKLFFDGNFYKEAGTEGCVIEGMDPGAHDLKMKYADGNMESYSVEVRENITSRIIFSYIPREQTGENTKSQKGYFSFFTGFGIAFPLGIIGNIMDTGYNPVIEISYTADTGMGKAGIGVITGATIDSIKQSLDNRYTMYCVPVGIFLGYRTDFGVPFCLFAKAAGGLVLNIFDYGAVTQSKYGQFLPSPFCAASGGMGWNIIPQVSLEAFCTFTCVFFKDMNFYGIGPGIGLCCNIR